MLYTKNSGLVEKLNACERELKGVKTEREQKMKQNKQLQEELSNAQEHTAALKSQQEVRDVSNTCAHIVFSLFRT